MRTITRRLQVNLGRRRRRFGTYIGTPARLAPSGKPYGFTTELAQHIGTWDPRTREPKHTTIVKKVGGVWYRFRLQH